MKQTLAMLFVTALLLFSLASVEIDRLRRLIYARSGCKKQKKRTPYGVLFF